MLARASICLACRLKNGSGRLISASCHRFSTSTTDLDGSPVTVPSYLHASDANTEQVLANDMEVHENFISEEEEKCILDEVEPYMKRLRYEYDHWDDAIHGYRETERRQWTKKNQTILQRVRDIAFPPGGPQLVHVHILDLAKDGYIKPHVDSVKFCGTTIAGLNLLSPAVMRLVHTEDKSQFADVMLIPRCLYVIKDRARYDYTHEILDEKTSQFKGKVVPRDRRISVICRNAPPEEST